MKNENKISVILPALKEPYLPILLAQLYAILDPYDYEILVIRSDKEKNFIKPTQDPHVRIYKSYGDSLERSILLGFSVAEGDKLIVMDADGSHPPKLIPQIIEKLNKYDLVIASRFIKEGEYKAPLSRQIITWFFTKLAHYLGYELSDPMSGFFGVRKSLINKICFKPFKWKIALEIFYRGEPKTAEIPFTFEYRKKGKSKTNLKVGLKILWDMVIMRI